MSQYVTKVRTSSGDLPIDYNALANRPDLQNMFSNPNLLINSDFRNPVNQRGQTSYSVSAWEYTIDRWRGKNVDVVVNANSITITNNSSEDGNFQQPLGTTLPSDNYIFSAKILKVTGSVYLYHRSGGTTLSAGVKTRTFTSSTSLGSVQFYLAAGASIEVEWAKLECGTIATPFVPRLYAEDLALCQRYYEKRTVIFFPYNGKVPARYYIAVNGDSHRATKHREPNLSFSQLTNYNNETVSATLDSSKTTHTKDYIRMITLTSDCSECLLRSTIEFDAEIH